MIHSRDYLARYLQERPAFLALVRGVECRLFAQAGVLDEPVLDFGCGDGYFAATAFTGRLFAGLDPDPGVVFEAGKSRAYSNLIVAGRGYFPFRSDYFGTVTANCVLEHIPDLTRVLPEVHRVLKPGGRFIFDVPSQNFADMLLGTAILRKLGFRQWARAYGTWFNSHSLHYHTDSPRVWHRRLEQHGFQVERWQYYLSPSAHRAFDAAHYLSVPRLISRKLTGKWVLFPNPVANRLFARWLRPYYEEDSPGEGPYIFFITRKR
ncbi:MAG: class I SAM-dependent methyltransferase [Desulfobulbales bacterium]